MLKRLKILALGALLALSSCFANAATSTVTTTSGTMPQTDLSTAQVTGTLPVLRGGTGLTTVGGASTFLMSNGTTLEWAAAVPTIGGDVSGAGNNQVLYTDGSGNLAGATTLTTDGLKLTLSTNGSTGGFSIGSAPITFYYDSGTGWARTIAPGGASMGVTSTLWGWTDSGDPSTGHKVLINGGNILMSTATPCLVFQTASPGYSPYVSVCGDSANDDVSITGGGLRVTGKMRSVGTTPTMGACGTSPSVAGGDGAMSVTVGTGGAATSCAVTFSATWGTAPVCVAQNDTDRVAYNMVTTATTLTITATAAFTASSKFHVLCMGY